jgi:hypothetical protein
MPSDDLLAWLGPAAEELTPEQIETVAEQARLIDARIDADLQDERDAALAAVVQFLLGETDAEEAKRTLTATRAAERRATAAAAQVGAMLTLSGTSEVAAAAAVGIDRMTLRDALGKGGPRRGGNGRRRT